MFYVKMGMKAEIHWGDTERKVYEVRDDSDSSIYQFVW